MRKSNRLTALFLCLIMIAGLLTACGGKSDNKGAATSAAKDANTETTAPENNSETTTPAGESGETTAASDTAEDVEPIQVVCGGKGFTEQYIMAWIMTILLQENTVHKVEALPGLSASAAANQALADGDIDMFVDYTGGMYMNILGHEYIPGTPLEEGLSVDKDEYASQFSFTVMEPLGFNNTYCMSMTQKSWERFGKPSCYSDLIEHQKDVRLGMDVTFRGRGDGYVPLCDMYGFDFKNITEMEINLAYSALTNDELDIVVGYATDGAIAKYDLVVLEDDLGFFPPHYSVPIMRTDFYEAHPDIVAQIERLQDAFTDGEMAEMNAKVAVDLMEPEDVAREWLAAKGLIQ